MSTLAEFLDDYLRRHGLNARELAHMAELNHQTLYGLLNPPEEGEYPSLRTLIKLAKATDTDICALVALAIPDFDALPHMDREVWLLSLRIRELPDHLRKVVDALLAVADDSRA